MLDTPAEPWTKTMSTRATFTFQDENSTHHVYKHCDGYPSGAAKFIRAALQHSWKLPRFEADEFACAFIAANKSSQEQMLADYDCSNPDHWYPGGEIRLVPGDWDSIGGIEYHYIISCKDGKLHIVAQTVRGFDEIMTDGLFAGTLDELDEWVKENKET